MGMAGVLFVVQPVVQIQHSDCVKGMKEECHLT